MGVTLEFLDWEPGPITEHLAWLFERVSEPPFPGDLRRLPAGMGAFTHMLYNPPGRQPTGAIDHPPAAPDPAGVTLRDDSWAVVGFSGGKDSTGAALKMRAAGRQVHLVHIRGLNRSHPHEVHAAQAIADHLGMPLTVVTVRQHGRTPYRESIMKNQLVLGITLDVGRGVGQGAHHYAGGNVATDNAGALVYEASFSDSQELYATLVPWLVAATGARVYQDWVACNTESFLLIDQHAPDVLPLVLSCMMPVRYKARLRDLYQQRHRVELLPGRCGTCWKCGQEYLHQVLLGKAEPNRARVQAAIRAIRKDLAVIWQAGAQPDTPSNVLAAVIEAEWLDWAPLVPYTQEYPWQARKAR